MAVISEWVSAWSTHTCRLPPLRTLLRRGHRGLRLPSRLRRGHTGLRLPSRLASSFLSHLYFQLPEDTRQWLEVLSVDRRRINFSKCLMDCVQALASEWLTAGFEDHSLQPEKSQLLIQNIFTLCFVPKTSSGCTFLRVDLLLKDLHLETEETCFTYIFLKTLPRKRNPASVSSRWDILVETLQGQIRPLHLLFFHRLCGATIVLLRLWKLTLKGKDTHGNHQEISFCLVLRWVSCSPG